MHLKFFSLIVKEIAGLNGKERNKFKKFHLKIVCSQKCK